LPSDPPPAAAEPPRRPSVPPAAVTEPDPPIAEGDMPPAIRTIVGGSFEGTRWTPEGDAIRRFYRSRGYAPIWLSASAGDSATRLVEVLEAAADHGLNPTEYRAGELRAMLTAAADPQRRAILDVLLTQAVHRYASDLQGARISSLTLPRDARHVTRPIDAVRTLASVAQTADPVAALAAFAPQDGAYQRMLVALARYRAIAASGGWPVIPGDAALGAGSVDPRVAIVRQRLSLTDGAPATGPQNPNSWDQDLTDAVKRFQKRHGIAEDGRVGGRTLRAMNVPVEQRIRALQVNLDRLRATPARSTGPEIVVNIPEQRLRVLEGEREVIAMHVVVGREARATPILSSRITEVKFNPTWTVPLRNAREDFLPRLQRNPQQFVNSSYRIFRGGEQIDPTTVDWAQVTPASFNYTIRQDAGPRNALGRMRLTLPDTPAIYLHDTPERQYFARDNRAQSSGCIRLERPVEMVEFVLRHNTQPWTPDRIRQMMDSSETRHIPVARPMPVHLVYTTAWVEPTGDISFREDIYRIDELILQRQGQRPVLNSRGA
jgi:L,D-transpeptidase YcbB